MLETLLQTKLYIPPLRPNLVFRPHLIERLNQGIAQGCKLTLVSAPAGFGKTTLASEWVGSFKVGADKESQKTNSVAWLSLDEDDSDLARFLTYFITSLSRAEGLGAIVGEGALSMLQSPQPPPAEPVLTSLINEVTTIPGRIILILDDYHLIDSSPIDNALTFLIERLPPQMHLVIATREDPRLPLARLRARGQLTEVRAADLRFSFTEAAEFLNQAMDLELSQEDILALETRTEGWIAGLQLAAISILGHDDTTSLIDSFTGSHRLVMDYLIEEVLEEQPKSVQTFLLQTAILDRLTGSLCDALTGQDNGQATLEMLDRANLFIVRLDEERQWYRYHHLFTDLLRKRLRQIQPEQMSALHRQAATWYEDQGMTTEALRHIFAAGDFEWAGYLVEQVGKAIVSKGGDWIAIRKWLEKLPKEVVHSRPRLSLVSAWIMHFSGQPEAAEPYLRAVESHLAVAEKRLFARVDRFEESTVEKSDEPISSSDMQSMRAEVVHIRALTACVRGDLDRAVELYQYALELLPSKELRLRALAIQGLADAYYLSADIATASPLYTEAIAIGLESGSIYQALASSSRLAELQVMQGHLHQAADTYQQMQNLSPRWGEQHPAVASYACVGMGGLMCEWNDLDAAVQQLSEGIERGKQGPNPRTMLIGYVTLARALQALGDADGALSSIQEGMRVWQQYPLTRGWGIPPVATYQARLSLVQGDVASTTRWAQDQGLRADGELSYQQEVEYITLARLLIAQGNGDAAVRLLQRLLEAAVTGGRILRVIEILLLHALTLHAQMKTDQAIATLKRALILTESEGFIRIFVDEGPPMAGLLNEALSRGITADYISRLLAAFHTEEPNGTTVLKSQDPEPEWIEPLSERELEVLQLIAEGLTNQEITSRLFISLNTVKTHTHNIYSKLNVHSRTQAIARSQELGILPRRQV